MKNHLLGSVLVLLVGLPHASPAQTAVYRSVDKDGNVTFSDKPGPGSTRMQVAPVQAVAPQSAPAKPAPAAASGKGAEPSPAAAAAGPKAVVYSEFSIVNPIEGEAVRSNAGSLTLGLRLTPELGDGHRISVLLDGRPFGNPTRNTVNTLVNIDRGTHQLAAEVIDAEGKVLASAGPVTFHLLRVSARTR